MVDNSDNSYHVVTTLHVDSTTIVDGFTISDGNADGSGPYGSGGGWYNDGSGIGNHSNPTIRNCKFYFNRADLGGAMLNFGEMGGNSSPTLLDCEFIENGAVISGGAIANRATNGYSSPELINCVFVHNNTGVNSGAILNYGAEGTSSPIMTNCLFINNQTQNGGAMLNFGQNGISNPVLTNCVFVFNHASFGGAMMNIGPEENSSPSMTNCIFYENSASNGPDMFNVFANPIISHSIFGQDSITVNHDNTITFIGDNFFSTYPEFVDTTNLRGPDGYFMTPDDGLMLRFTSLALNAGDPNTDPSLFPGGPDHLVDLAGQPRFNNRIDMGAYEYKDVCIDFNGIVYVDSAAVTGTNDGTSWDNAFTDLQDALRRAWECPGKVDTILVAKGTYYPTPTTNRDTSFWIPNGVVMLGGFCPGDGDTSLADRDWRVHETILSGNIGMNVSTDNSYHVVRTNHLDSTTVVDGFTIRDGYADGGSPVMVGDG